MPYSPACVALRLLAYFPHPPRLCRYYLFFLSIPLFQALERPFATFVRPRVNACGPLARKLYEWAEVAGTSLAISYTGLAFHAMSTFERWGVDPFACHKPLCSVFTGLQESLAVWGHLLFCGHFICIGLHAFFWLANKMCRPKRNSTRAPSRTAAGDGDAKSKSQ